MEQNQTEEKLLTIKEYAEKAGVSQQAVYKRINNPNTDLHKYVVEKGNKKYLKPEALEIIPPRQTPEKSENDILHEMVEMLRNELAEKNEQIKSLNTQLELMTDSVNKTAQALAETQISLQAAQALHAGTIQQQREEKEVVSDPNPTTETTKEKRGFFARFFG